MQNRRNFLLTLTAGLAATGFVVATVLADELIGVITKVDIDGKKLTVIPKDSEKEVQITVNDDTETVTKDGTVKLDLEKLSKRVDGAKEKGKKGVTATITHEKNVASKIQFKKGFGKKKAE
jgi:hypothetical protein